MTLLKVAQAYGHARDLLSVSDKVLIDGSGSSNGVYVVLCEVIAITDEGIVRLHKIKEYYLSGQEKAASGEITCPQDCFKKSLAKRLAEQNNFFGWLVEQLKS